MATSRLELVISAKDEASSTLRRIGETAAGFLSAEIIGRGVDALVEGAKQILSTAMDYQSGMNLFKEVSGATGAEMERAGALAVALGADLSLPATSAADAAEAMVELAKAGLSVNNTMGAAKGTLQLAAAGALEEAQAAEITANALLMFNMKGEEATKVADLLAAAANASSAEVTDMADSLKMAGTVFAAAGVPIDDVTAAITEMANAGIKGSDAGTSLKTMLLALQAPTDKAKEALDELGISVYDASGQMRPMRDIIGQFQNALKGATQEEQAFALKTIFGTDAIRAANVVLMGGVDAYDQMHEAVNKAGAAADIAAARSAGLRGALDGLISTVETLALQAVIPLLGPMEQVVRGFTEWLTGLGNLGPAIDGMIGSITGLGNTTSQTGAWIQQTWQAIQEVVAAVIPAIQLVITTGMGVVSRFMEEHGAEIRQFVESAWVQIQNIITLAVQLIQATIVPVFTAIAEFIFNHGTEIQGYITGAWDLIKNAIQLALDLITGIIRIALDIIRGDWDALGGDLHTLITNIWNDIKGIFDGALKVIGNLLKTALDALLGDWQGGLGRIADWLRGFRLPNPFAAIQGFIDGARGAIESFLNWLRGLVVPNPFGGVAPPAGGGSGSDLSGRLAPVTAAGDTYYITVNTQATAGTYLADIQMARALAGV